MTRRTAGILGIAILTAIALLVPFGASPALATSSADLDPDTPGLPPVGITLIDQYQAVGNPGVWISIYSIAGSIGGKLEFVGGPGVNPTPNLYLFGTTGSQDPIQGAIPEELIAGVPRDELGDQYIPTEQAAYQAAGRSPQQDRAMADALKNASLCNPKIIQCPHPPPQSNVGQIYDSGCLIIDTANMYWRGCYRRYITQNSDPGYWYTADSSQGSGYGGNYWLKTGRTGFGYHGSGDDGVSRTIVNWRPTAQMNGDNCGSTSISLSAFGVSMSESFPLCPSNITIKFYDPNVYFRSQWNGCDGGDEGGVGSAVETNTKVPHGKGSAMVYYIYAYSSAWC